MLFSCPLTSTAKYRAKIQFFFRIHKFQGLFRKKSYQFKFQNNPKQCAKSAAEIKARE